MLEIKILKLDSGNEIYYKKFFILYLKFWVLSAHRNCGKRTFNKLVGKTHSCLRSAAAIAAFPPLLSSKKIIDSIFVVVDFELHIAASYYRFLYIYIHRELTRRDMGLKALLNQEVLSNNFKVRGVDCFLVKVNFWV